MVTVHYQRGLLRRRSLGLAVGALAVLSALPLASVSADTDLVPVANDSIDADVGAPPESGEDFEQLLEEAQTLTLEQRPIDARAKLQRALQLRPTDYRPHMLLGQYYLFDVGHFKLAYRYILTAQELFMKQFGTADGLVDQDHAREHVTLLYLRSEAELNLDKYAESLKTLDTFGSLYWTDWYPGTRAWVLMKLKRVDEAIQVAQSALAQESDRRRIYNVLGILLSIRGQRELSLRAFQQAIAQEVALGSLGQIATPLNNAGEVYREMFRDSLAEASWIRAIRLPDGCDHILPSLNLSILYIDETRFEMADRTLSDFQACFAQHMERQDTEHRALLALARGKILLRTGKVDDALKELGASLERQQWFGKIGTNENDVRFAALIVTAQALRAKAAAIRDTDFDSVQDRLEALASLPALAVRAWWFERQAREVGVSELDDLEDLAIRNTDTMVEYPTLGSLFRGFPVRSFRKRITRQMTGDDRPESHSYYKLYLAENLIAHGEYREADTLLHEILPQFRPIDRLARAHALSLLLELRRDEHWFFHRATEAEVRESIQLREELFELLPSDLRYLDLALPVTVAISANTAAARGVADDIRSRLERRFETRNVGEARFQLQIAAEPQGTDTQVTLRLIDGQHGSARVAETAVLGADGKNRSGLVNAFTAKVFSHRADPAGEPVPRLELLDGVMGR